MHNYQRRQTTKQSITLDSLMQQLPAFCRQYFISLENVKGINTQVTYARSLYVFFHFIVQNNPEYKTITSIPFSCLQNLTSEDIEEFMHYLSSYKLHDRIRTNGNAGKKEKLAAVRSMFDYFFRHGHLLSNPAAIVATPKIKESNIITLTGDEVHTLLNGIAYGSNLSKKQRTYYYKTYLRDYAVVTILLNLGLRVSELVALDLEDVHIENETLPQLLSTLSDEILKEESDDVFLLQQTALSLLNEKKLLSYSGWLNILRKGGDEDQVYFNSSTGSAILAYLLFERPELLAYPNCPEPALFLSLKNKRMEVRSVQYMFSNHCKRYIGRPLFPHKCRSTYGTDLYNATGDIYLVAECLGHKDVNTTTRHYAKADLQRKRAAANMKLR